MAKKTSNRRKKRHASVNVPGHKQRTAQGRVYNQVRPDQKSRRTKHKRIEFVLNPAYDEDRKMIELLDSLHGGKSDYIREALALKMEADTQPPIHELFNEMMRAIAILGSLIDTLPTTEYFDNGFNGLMERLSNFSVRMVQAVEVAPAPVYQEPPMTETDTQPAIVQSSGIAMDRPRPRKQLPRAVVQAEAEPDELSEADAVRLAKIMAASIKRAQPGRGG